MPFSPPPNRLTLQITLIYIYTQKYSLSALYMIVVCKTLWFAFYFQCWVSSCGGGLGKVRLHHEVLLLLLLVLLPIIMFLAASQNFHSLLSNSKSLLKYLVKLNVKFLIHVRSTWKILGFFFFFLSVLFLFFNFVMLL